MGTKTSLGTLGKVLEILREENINDIPEDISPEDLAFNIVFLIDKERLIELLTAIEGEVKPDMTDEGAVSILESFFTNMEKSLTKFVRILNRDFELQKNLVTEKMNLMIDKVTEEIISSIDLESLSNMVLESFPKK